MAEEVGQIDGTEQQGSTGEEAAVQNEIEAEARKVGWLPKSEWVGAPPRYGFVDAQTFVDRGETIVPILNANLKHTREALESLRTSSAKATKFMADANARTLKERDWVLAELGTVRIRLCGTPIEAGTPKRFFRHRDCRSGWLSVFGRIQDTFSRSISALYCVSLLVPERQSSYTRTAQTRALVGSNPEK